MNKMLFFLYTRFLIQDPVFGYTDFDSTAFIDDRAFDLLSCIIIDEKMGQKVLMMRESIYVQDVKTCHFLKSVLILKDILLN
ncbi:hypothetical protein JW835_07585 [bacterium]|nr:hypothetical protein [bacterium]